MRNHSKVLSANICLASLLLCFIFASCGGSYEETVAGVKVPVPNSMKRSGDKPVEISVFGFGAGQAFFQGNMDVDQVVEFYKKELPSRGWQPSMNLQSGAAMLAYTKEGRTVLVAVTKDKNETILNLTVGGTGK